MINKIKECEELYKIIKTDDLGTFKANFLSINTSKYYLNNNHTIIRDNLIKPCFKAAMIIPKISDDKYLMVIQPRVATLKGITVEFPAGLINDDETIIDGVKRELLEETGYSCEHPKLLIEYYQDTAVSPATISLVMADNCHKIKEQKLDEDEFVTYIEVSLDDIYTLIKEKYIVDGNTLLCYEFIKNKEII